MSEAESTIHETTNGAAPRAKRKANNQPIHAQVVDHVAIRREATKALVAERTYHRKRDAEITEELGDGNILSDGAHLRGLPSIVVPTVGSAPMARRGNSPTMKVDSDGVVSSEIRVRAAGTKTRNKVSTPKTDKAPRLARRSDEQIDALVDKVVALVKNTPEGLRAEAIREALHLEAKELPRVFSRAKARKVLKSKGLKRATTYLARG